MSEHEVTRTLVKSQPEVWAQCSEADSLGRHLSGSFGEIRITRLEPEHSVAWEGEEVSGTVRIEPSAWGTRVTLSVQVEQEEARQVEAEEPDVEPDELLDEPGGALAVQDSEEGAQAVPAAEEPPPADPVSEPTTFLARLRARFRRAPEPETPADEGPEPVMETAQSDAPEPTVEEPQAQVPEPAFEEPVAHPPSPAPEEGPDTTAALTAALESLGQAHHRPFSRA